MQEAGVKCVGGGSARCRDTVIMTHCTRKGGGTLMSEPLSSKMLMKARLCLTPTS